MSQQRDAATSDATRYLCAGAELDEEFSNQIISELFSQSKRGVAPSFGFDLVPVVKHCVRGRRRRAVRDAILLVLVLVELVLFPVVTGLAILAAFLLRGTNLRSRIEARVVGLIALAALALVGYWVFSGQAVPQAAPAINVLTWGFFVGRVDVLLVSLLVLLVAASAVRYGEWHIAQLLVGWQLHEDRFDPDATRVTLRPWMQRRLDDIAFQQYANATSFQSGADRPFVGAGPVGRWWSFAVHLRAGAGAGSGGAPEFEPFTPWDVHRFITERLATLRKPISDNLIAPGWYRLEGQPIHLAYPEGHLPEAQVARVANGPTGNLRHFKSMRAEWQGRELVATTFLHLAMDANTLYVEFTPCLLSPIRGDYKNVDNWNLPRRSEMAQEMGKAVAEVIPTLFGSAQRLVRAYWVPYLERLTSQRQEWLAKTQRYVLDYGARLSIRELASITEPKNYLQLFDPDKHVLSPRRYIQLLDAEKHTKSIEALVLDAIVDFLDARGADTSEVRTRRSAILDSGVFVTTMQGDIATWGQRAEAAG